MYTEGILGKGVFSTGVVVCMRSSAILDNSGPGASVLRKVQITLPVNTFSIFQKKP